MLLDFNIQFLVHNFLEADLSVFGLHLFIELSNCFITLFKECILLLKLLLEVPDLFLITIDLILQVELSDFATTTYNCWMILTWTIGWSREPLKAINS